MRVPEHVFCSTDPSSWSVKMRTMRKPSDLFCPPSAPSGTVTATQHPTLTATVNSIVESWQLIADGTISGGMIPKVETCIYALDQGVEGVVIMDGKIPHAVLLELFTNQGTGTLIHK